MSSHLFVIGCMCGMEFVDELPVAEMLLYGRYESYSVVELDSSRMSVFVTYLFVISYHFTEFLKPICLLMRPVVNLWQFGIFSSKFCCVTRDFFQRP